MWWWRSNCGMGIFVKFHGCKNLKLVLFDLFIAWLLPLILAENECSGPDQANWSFRAAQDSSLISCRWGDPVLNPVEMFEALPSFWVVSKFLNFNMSKHYFAFETLLIKLLINLRNFQSRKGYTLMSLMNNALAILVLACLLSLCWF